MCNDYHDTPNHLSNCLSTYFEAAEFSCRLEVSFGFQNQPLASFIKIIAGDFDAKTGTGQKKYPRSIGKHGKGIMNSNGEHLLELCNRQNLILTNTTFNHKKAHRITWVGPEKESDNRKNPIRNQIDNIIMRIDQ